MSFGLGIQEPHSSMNKHKHFPSVCMPKIHKLCVHTIHASPYFVWCTQLSYFSQEFLNPDFNRKAMGECSPSSFTQLTTNSRETLGSQNPGKELTYKGGGWAKTNHAMLKPPLSCRKIQLRYLEQLEPKCHLGSGFKNHTRV